MKHILLLLLLRPIGLTAAGTTEHESMPAAALAEAVNYAEHEPMAAT